MASTSKKAAATKLILTPSITLKGHGGEVPSIAYFPDGRRMISGSLDETVRQWDLKAGREIEEARRAFEEKLYAVAVSRDGRWIVTSGVEELKACEVKTGTVKTFKGDSHTITCIDISTNNTRLAGGSDGATARVWNLETGKLVAGPFKSENWVGAVRFSTDSKKLAVKMDSDQCLEIWDVQTQKLDIKIGNRSQVHITTIYEFDASTLETVGTPFKGHTKDVSNLALSFDHALLASVSFDETIKLWAVESRQLLASFDVHNIDRLVLSPDSRQLAYAESDDSIYICDTPPEVLAQARNIARKKSNLDHLLNSDATRRPPAGQRKPPIHAIPIVQRPLSTRDLRQPAFSRLGKLLRFSRANTVPVRHTQPRDLLDVPATLPLPSSLSAQAAPRFDHFEISSPPPSSGGVAQSLRQHLSFLVPRHSHGPPVIEVAPNRKFTRLAAAKLPEYKKVDDTRYPSNQQGAVPQENDTADIDSLPDVHWFKAFLCYYSCLSHGRLRIPPRWRLERVDVPRQDGAANSSPGGARSRS